MTLRYWKDAKYRKVGRLYPGDDDLIHIIYDGIGELGTMTIEQAENILAGVEPQTISPDGSSDLSMPGTGYKMTIPVDGRLYLAIAKQVRNMLDKWPRRKSALWLPDEFGGVGIFESVFTITSIGDCYHIGDINREWKVEDIIGKKLIVYKETEMGIIFITFTITAWEITNYTIILDPVDTSYLLWTVRNELDFRGRVQFIPPTSISEWLLDLSKSWTGARSNIPYPEIYSPRYSLAGIEEIRFQFLYKSKYGGHPSNGSEPFNQVIVVQIDNTEIYQWIPYCATVKKTIGRTEYRCNPDYPKYTTIVIPKSKWSGLLSAVIRIFLYGSSVSSGSFFYSPDVAAVTGITLIPSACQTEDLLEKDKYRIYDPVKKDYILDDNSLPILSEPYWRDVTEAGEAITTTAINWYWDGVGSVCLSPYPEYISEITFDNEIRIDVQNGTDLRIRDYTPGARQLEHEGHWVDRGSIDITSLCREGINTITVSVKDNNSGKVGFVSPLYVKRKFT